ncbi:SusC/RagA family TonB-linked outer membrane protein [Bacteroidia bacterium]|nr:SusC/RagA family TonB-linked outer membrane protein [Bacteroidia bacterium]
MLICFSVSVGAAFAQNKQVQGKVVDDGGEPVIGASISVKGNASVGTSTNVDGRFNLSVPSSATTLLVKYLGLQDQEVAVASNVDVTLHASDNSLDEVVVTGYGSTNQRALASSVSVIKADALKDVPSASFDQMLQGRAAGVSVTTPSAGVGQPPIVNIRGVSSINSGTEPLYVIDGVPMISGDLAGGRTATGNANALSDINPADIETMSVLKDAAATALYGSRAANGVILITTKKGTRGNVKINYDANFGFSQATNYIKTLNAQEYVDFKNQAYLNRYGSFPTTGPLFNLMQDSKGKTIDTNWADEVYQNGNTQSHAVSISGATDKADFYMSANYFDQEGIVIGDAYDRIGIRANANVQPAKYLKVGLNSNYSHGHTHYTDAARNGSLIAASGFPRIALIMPSNLPVRNEDGTPYYEYEKGSGIGWGANKFNTTFANPIALNEFGNGIDTWVNRIIASGYAEITPVEDLKFKTLLGIDHSATENNRYWNPYNGDGYNNDGLANASFDKRTQWTWTNTATFNKSFDLHNVTAIAGVESNNYKWNYWTVQGRELTDFSFDEIYAGYTTYTGGGDKYEKSLVSYFGNVNYNYDYKYMLSANYRRDGYSPLGVNSRWGDFYGAAIGWRISKESFLENNSFLDDLKLKASYGVVGNANIGWYPAQSYYSSAYYADNGALIMTNIGDPNLRWESGENFDLGFESKFLNRFSFDFDWYYRRTKDMILDVAQAPSTGIYNSILKTNAGKMLNTGVELTLSADVLKTRDFLWNSTFNITFNSNEVLKLTEDLLHTDGTTSINSITVEGKSMGQLYLYPTGGIDPATGRRIFLLPDGAKTYFTMESGTATWWDADGVTKHSQSEFKQEIFGNTLPTYYGGWANAFQYKGFDLNLFFQFSGGNKIWNGMKASASDMRYWNNTKDVLTKAWTTPGQKAEFAKPIYGDNYSNGSAMSLSDYVEDGDYLRLKNVSLGYTFDTKKWAQSIGLNVSSLRVYAQAQNLFVITKYSGMDPEVISDVTMPNLAGGVDKNTLPQARTYTVGFNLTF